MEIMEERKKEGKNNRKIRNKMAEIYLNIK